MFKKYAVIIASGFFGLLTGLQTAMAQTGTDASRYPVLSSRCEPTSITVGDHVKFTVSAVVPELQRLIVRNPFGGKDETTWTLIGQPFVTEEKVSASEWRRNTEFTLTTFEVGEVEIPEVEVSYQPPGGGEPIVRSVSGISVNVNSVLPADAAEVPLADIKDPLPIPLPAWVPWVIGGIAALLALVVGLFVWRRMRGKFANLIKPPLRPDEWALLRIEELEREKLIEQKKLKELYTRLSEILRQYLGKVYELKAMDMTTGELLTHLEDLEAEEREDQRTSFRTARQYLSELLDEADLVKFAQFLPEQARSRNALEKGREVVRLTRYKLEPPPPEPAASAPTQPSQPPSPPPQAAPPRSGYESQTFGRREEVHR